MEAKKKATEAAQHIHINCINALTGYTCKDSDNEYIIQKNKVFNLLNKSPKTTMADTHALNVSLVTGSRLPSILMRT